MNNAGYGYRAGVEEGEEVAVDQLFGANFFGPVAMIKSTLPAMRACRSGVMINISSIAARVAPAQAAQTIVVVVEAPVLPFLFLLGRDAVGGFRGLEEAQRTELDAWEDVSVDSGFVDH